MIIWKMSISVLFRPSVIRGPWSKLFKTIEYSVTSDNQAWLQCPKFNSLYNNLILVFFITLI